MGRVEQFPQRLVAAEQRIDREVVVRVVAVVEPPTEDRVQVQRVDPEVDQVVQPLDDPEQVAALEPMRRGRRVPRLQVAGLADAIARREPVGKDLVEDRVADPVRGIDAHRRWRCGGRLPIAWSGRSGWARRRSRAWRRRSKAARRPSLVVARRRSARLTRSVVVPDGRADGTSREVGVSSDRPDGLGRLVQRRQLGSWGAAICWLRDAPPASGSCPCPPAAFVLETCVRCHSASKCCAKGKLCRQPARNRPSIASNASSRRPMHGITQPTQFSGTTSTIEDLASDSACI